MICLHFLWLMGPPSTYTSRLTTWVFSPDLYLSFWDFIMLCPLYLIPFLSCFLSLFCFLFHFVLAVPMHRCLGQHFCMSLLFSIVRYSLGVNCFFAGQSIIVFAATLTVKIKLYNYYYCNYVIVIYFSCVIIISISITASNASWSIKVVLLNVFVFWMFHGRVMFFFLCLSPFYIFCKLNFIRLFPSIIKYCAKKLCILLLYLEYILALLLSTLMFLLLPFLYVFLSI